MDINDFDSGNYDIKGRYSYVELQQTAERKLMLSAKKYIKIFIYIIIAMVVILGGTFALQHATSNVAVVGTFFSYFYLLVLGFTMFFGLYSVFDTLKKIKNLNHIYKHDMRAIQKKLELSEIFMEIPKVDYCKFDSPIHIIVWYLKHKDQYEDE